MTPTNSSTSFGGDAPSPFITCRRATSIPSESITFAHRYFPFWKIGENSEPLRSGSKPRSDSVWIASTETPSRLVNLELPLATFGSSSVLAVALSRQRSAKVGVFVTEQPVVVDCAQAHEVFT